MTPVRPASPVRYAAGGFVLVGVVMIVLALTILGLSLFSLSSYEAQFMNRSLDGEQALQYAMSGLDRARFALTVSPQTLSRVKQSLPYENVTYARARQDKGGPVADSMGVVIGGGNDVEILVQAEYRGVTRRVQGLYQPISETNYYKRLFSIAAGGIEVNDKVGPPISQDAVGTVVLGAAGYPDSIWVNNSNSLWQTRASGMPPAGISNYGVNRRYVPVPSVLSFINGHAAGATVRQHGVATYNLTGPSGSVSYWYTDNPDLHPPDDYDFSCYFSGDATINVNGLAVWLLPRGLRLGGSTTVNATGGDDCLVIVARDGYDDNDDHNPGAIWFFGGLTANIPVILVSDGWVKLEQFSRIGGTSLVPQLSIFAGSLLLTGPSEASGSYMRLAHGGSGMDALIDQLMAAGALPNAVSTVPFALRPGTWRVLQ